ncbi:heme oxygenase (biliverdin-producing) [Nocardia arthritidis]|uniref:Biliverdin-producing heme oxygenase n=1 Tax=Nocardia arthritidis TaxID=228602 RepID=A0A6G9YFJ0_9NOCA|nr:biliverdin-producing heme oxygenase [Nocardia arthritidis]QIS11958.1 biliverdin-producing heme oxygenase [Nocardia arthritidis]
MSDTLTETVPFSTLLRTATEQQHSDAENSSFVGDLLGGKLGIDAYIALSGQLWFVYRALEANSARLAANTVAAPFIRAELARTPELERDLAHLAGPDWRAELTPLPATAAYAARIEECARDWPAGFIAHHYTRYLGDLSGGQIIRGSAEKQWNLPKRGDGVRFYVFENIGNPAAFKREYREALDNLRFDAAEQGRVLEEAQRAFAFNAAVFQELTALYPPLAA